MTPSSNICHVTETTIYIAQFRATFLFLLKSRLLTVDLVLAHHGLVEALVVGRSAHVDSLAASLCSSRSHWTCVNADAISCVLTEYLLVRCDNGDRKFRFRCPVFTSGACLIRRLRGGGRVVDRDGDDEDGGDHRGGDQRRQTQALGVHFVYFTSVESRE